MALRFFADHCISNFIIKTLQDAGNEVFRLRDYHVSVQSRTIEPAWNVLMIGETSDDNKYSCLTLLSLTLIILL